MLLTGTPLQNNVDELFSLLAFIDPVEFSSLATFKAQFTDLRDPSQVREPGCAHSAWRTAS